MRWCFVINPAAGGRGSGDLPALLSAIKTCFAGAEIKLAAHPAELTEWAREQGERADKVVVAVGGDGTVNAVARGLLGGKAMMGVLPWGSGNDFARMLGMSVKTDRALTQLAQAGEVTVDVGQVRWQDRDTDWQQTVFVNSLGIGLEAEVAHRAGQARVFRGFTRYLVAALIELMRFRPSLLQLTMDSVSIEQRQLLVALNNGRWAGGGFMLAPQARLDSGVFELTRADALPRWRLLMLLPTTLWGGHRGRHGVHQVQVTRCQLNCAEGVAVHADGEVLSRQACRLEVELRPAALRLLRPPAQRLT